MVTVDDARAIAAGLERSYEVVVRGRLKFRVGSLVYVAFSQDEAIMELAFPKDWRAALVEAEPDTFVLPRASDLRYHWIGVRLARIDHDELRTLVVEAWRMCVPKKVAAAYDAAAGVPGVTARRGAARSGPARTGRGSSPPRRTR